VGKSNRPRLKYRCFGTPAVIVFFVISGFCIQLPFIGKEKLARPYKGETSTRRAFGVEGASCGGNGAAIFRAFVVIKLAVGGFDKFGGSAAVFRVNGDADADAHGRLCGVEQF